MEKLCPFSKTPCGDWCRLCEKDSCMFEIIANNLEGIPEKIVSQAPKSEHIPQVSSDNISDQLANTVQMVIKQDHIVWTVFGVFWPANALLLVALFNTGTLPRSPVGMIVSGVGLIMSIVWDRIQRRAIAHQEFYEAIIQRIEAEHLRIPSDIALSAKLNEQLFKDKTKCTGRVRPLMKYTSIVSAVLWLLAFLWFAHVLEPLILCSLKFRTALCLSYGRKTRIAPLRLENTALPVIRLTGHCFPSLRWPIKTAIKRPSSPFLREAPRQSNPWQR